MHDLHEGFVYFWEIITGVFDDDRSKTLRILSFVMLFLGILWAGLNYFRAERIADVSTALEDSPAAAIRHGRNEAMEKLMDAAKTVGTMRRGGEAIARSLAETNASPFNIEGYNELGLEDVSGLSEFAPDSPLVEEKEAAQKQDIMVKALMVSGRTRYAVIDYASQKGAVIRQGQELPGGGGRVVRITNEGITVRNDNSEFTYTIK